MRIRFYAHASFRLEVDGFAVITDPYTPGPHNSGFDSIGEPADVVIMSSATDPFHSDPSHVRGDPTVVSALELLPEGAEARGLNVRPFPAMESMTFEFGRDPDANAMYLFTRIDLMAKHRALHRGDVPLSQPAQIGTGVCAARRGASNSHLSRVEPEPIAENPGAFPDP